MSVAESSFDLAAVKGFDRALMRGYIDLLNRGGRFDLARPYLAWHVRHRVRRIRAGYVAELQLGPGREVATWLQARIKDLAEFLTSVVPIPIGWHALVAAGKSGVGAATATISMGGLILGIPAAAAGLGAALIALLGSCFCHLLGVALWSSYIAIALAVASVARGRSKLRRAQANGQAVSELEQELLAKLDVRPPLQIPWAVVRSLAFVGATAVTFLARAIAATAYAHHRSVPVVLIQPGSFYVALSLAGLAVLSLPFALRSTPRELPDTAA